VIDVLVNEEENATTVIVPDYQLSLAIGKRGQNARLAAKLTGLKIDIKSESEAREEGLLPEETGTHDENLFPEEDNSGEQGERFLSEADEDEEHAKDDDLFT